MIQEETTPYKAAQSYGPLDTDLFFGREAEGSALARFLIGRSVSVLTAPSGIGKTSLLLAKVMPLLERERWHTVYARPGKDTIGLLLSSFVDRLLPNLDQEVEVLQAIAAERGGDTGLREAIDWLLGLPRKERVGFRLFAPKSFVDSGALPMICRALAGSIQIVDLIEHYEAVSAETSALGLTPRTTVSELAAALGQDRVRKSWAFWRGQFAAAKNLKELAAVFEKEWAPLRPGMTGAILVLDQFEEIFTLHRSGTVEALFEDFTAFLADEGSALPASGASGRGLVPTSTKRPLQLVLSLRKEFFADLVPHIGKFGKVEQMTYFLGALSLEEARSALENPAAIYQCSFSEEGTGRLKCADRILLLSLDEGAVADEIEAKSATGDGEPALTELPDERRYSPALISLVGAHLWARLKDNPGTPMPLTWGDFHRLVPRLDNVFASYLEEALAKLAGSKLADEVDRFDVLELLDRLVTASGYRNIIAQDALIAQMPMKPDIALDLLNELDNSLKLIRREGRRGAKFVEIMHERLIPSIRQTMASSRQLDPSRATLASAFDMLNILQDDPNTTRDPLPAYSRETLQKHMKRLNLDSLAAKNLLRSLLASGPPADARDQLNPMAAKSWAAAICALSDKLGQKAAIRSDRAPLLAGYDLEAAIDDLTRQGAAADPGRARQVALSALADRSPMAGQCIEAVFGGDALQGVAL